jgi:hypothetical protein
MTEIEKMCQKYQNKNTQEEEIKVIEKSNISNIKKLDLFQKVKEKYTTTEEVKKDLKCIKEIFINDISRYNILIQKILSYIIIIIVLKYLEVFSVTQEIKISYWLFIALMYIGSFFFSFIALKKKWTAFISSTLKELAQIVFTGFGILCVGIVFSIFESFTMEKIKLLGVIVILALFTKFYLALFTYFEQIEELNDEH